MPVSTFTASARSKGMDWPELHLPEDWRGALQSAAGRKRILVLGPTDAGKTSFIRALAAVAPEPLGLVDLDPGQKMLGPPGTAGLGSIEHLCRFIFVGSTSASNLGGIGRAAAALAADAARAGAFVVNTAGFVVGLGARLQAITAKAVQPDLLVEIGVNPTVDPIVAASGEVPLIRLGRSPAARRKSPAARAALRQQAFAAALSGAEPLRLRQVVFHPGPPLPWPTTARPVCALADDDGTDMCVGVCAGFDEEAAFVDAPPPPRPVRLVRLGKMWAEPQPAGGWRLLEKLHPSWLPA